LFKFNLKANLHTYLDRPLEPAIWYWRVIVEQTTNNISDWWAEKLFLPNLPRVLEQFQLGYERLVNAAQLKTDVINEAIVKADADGRLSFSEIVDQCVFRVQASSWYNHPDLPENTPPYDFDLNAEDMNKIFLAIHANLAIKILNLSNIDLSGDFHHLLLKLFQARNDFTVINLTNTNLTNDSLNDLLEALNYNSKTRGIPLIENLILANNRINAINFIINFIYDCACNFYQQQRQKPDIASIQSLPLTKINLKNNLIQPKEPNIPYGFDILLQGYVTRLHEQQCPLNLTIFLSGNIIPIHVPHPFQKIIKGNKWRCGFFVTKHLAKRRSIMQPDQYLTPENGFIYLVCKKNVFPGHSSIFTEMLNDTGQLELRKLELLSQVSYDLKNDCSLTGVIGDNILEAPTLSKERDKLYFQIWLVKSFLIQQLIKNVESTHIVDKVKFSIDGIIGHNCTTWAIEKLRGIGLQVDYALIPVNAASNQGLLWNLYQAYCPDALKFF
jgi:hypothetical protein